jgi:protein-S-isoprenylcysteine O-methyltransferase Ste14
MPDTLNSSPAEVGVIAPPPILVLIALGVGVGLSLAFPMGWLSRVPDLARWIAGGALILATALLEALASGRFRRADTPVQPRKGVRRLVTDGIFGVMRNPMYVGFLLFQLGVAIAGAFDWALVSTAAWFVFQHVFVVRREERYLTTLFGEEYRAYCKRVRRYGLI